MQRQEFLGGTRLPVGMRQMVETVEVDGLQACFAAMASASVDLPLLDGPRMQMRGPSVSRFMDGGMGKGRQAVAAGPAAP